MIECTWCHNEIEITDGKCPQCKEKLYEVSEADFDEVEEQHVNAEKAIIDNFKCAKCACNECITKEVAMTGTGLSKLFDIEHNHYLFVSCTNCGFVEVYNPDILNQKKTGQLGTIMDILFGS